jgi:hypothetical protein
MKRRWNSALWLGFVCVLVGLFSYEYLVRYPALRDFPWLNLLLLALGGFLLALGLVRAFGRPHIYRGKIFGSIFSILSAVGIAFFCYVTFVVLKQVPPSASAPAVGAKAPEFTLPNQNGRDISLVDLLATQNTRAAVLIFYRGHW